MIKYKLTDDKGNIEKINLIFNGDGLLKFEGTGTKINLRVSEKGGLRLFRESEQVRVSMELIVGKTTKMKIHDKTQNLYVDCDVKARKIEVRDIKNIRIDYDMLNGEEIADTISLKIGATK